jgi:hypothetical protein
MANGFAGSQDAGCHTRDQQVAGHDRRHCKADCRGDIKGGTPHQESHREMDNHHVDWMSAHARSGSHTRSFLSFRRSLRDPTSLPLH